jgi:glucose-1-phosphate cytidylyltransferase
MKCVLLAGNDASRIAGGADVPKPLTEIGGQPVIARVMDIYSHFGHRDFVVAAGRKALEIKRFFASYHLACNDITVTGGSGGLQLTPSGPPGAGTGTVSVVDTGPDAMSAGRLRRLRRWLTPGETFMCSYSDGLGNIDIAALLAFHRAHGKLATVTAVRPPARLGCLELKGERVNALSETIRSNGSWINGGFFVFEPGVMDYLADDSEALEQAPLAQMARDGELMAYRHEGFWHPLDSVRDRDRLDLLSRGDTPPWMQFASPPRPGRPAVAV